MTGGLEPVGIFFIALLVVVVITALTFLGAKQLRKRYTNWEQTRYEEMLDNVAYNSRSETTSFSSH